MKRCMSLMLMLALLAGCAKPDFSDTSGQGYRLSSFEGSWLVINYWATWCAPCIKEIPELIALDENHEDIRVFGVNFDAPPPAEMAAQIEKMKITFPVLAEDPYLRLGVEKPTVLPTTVIVGPDGQVASVLVGPQTEESLLAAIGDRAGSP